TTAELAAIVHRNAAWQTSALGFGSLQRLRYFHPRHSPIRFQADALPRELVHHRQNTERSAIGELVAHKIHAPTLVRSARGGDASTLAASHLAALLSAHDQLLLRVQPVDALRVHFPTFSPQQHGQSSVAADESHLC